MKSPNERRRVIVNDEKRKLSSKKFQIENPPVPERKLVKIHEMLVL